MKLVLIGAPGSGKGTLAKGLEKKFGWLHISTGDLLRDEIAADSDIGRTAKDLISQGLFVPDDIIIKMVENRLKKDDAKNGYMLDGFPRTLIQFEKMKEKIEVDWVVNLDVDKEVLIKRLTSRKICPSCKEVYSTLMQDIDICKKCGEKLQVRADDNVQSIEKRLEVFEKETKPILACFEKMNKLLTFVGDMTPEENLKRVQDTLAKLEGK